MVDQAFLQQLSGASLTFAEVTYKLPDHLSLLQTFNWQFYDVHPDFPRLNRFLDFWDKEIEGPIVSVLVTHRQLIKPAELKLVDHMYRLH